VKESDGVYVHFRDALGRFASGAGRKCNDRLSRFVSCVPVTLADGSASRAGGAFAGPLVFGMDLEPEARELLPWVLASVHGSLILT
jgi:hypothetical protein